MKSDPGKKAANSKTPKKSTPNSAAAAKSAAAKASVKVTKKSIPAKKAAAKSAAAKSAMGGAQMGERVRRQQSGLFVETLNAPFTRREPRPDVPRSGAQVRIAKTATTVSKPHVAREELTPFAGWKALASDEDIARIQKERKRFSHDASFDD